jgi:hypothetical protein
MRSGDGMGDGLTGSYAMALNKGGRNGFSRVRGFWTVRLWSQCPKMISLCVVG